MSSFSIYFIGVVVLVAGMGFAAYLLNVPGMWIVVGLIVAIGLGIISATNRTKPKDPPV